MSSLKTSYEEWWDRKVTKMITSIAGLRQFKKNSLEKSQGIEYLFVMYFYVWVPLYYSILIDWRAHFCCFWLSSWELVPYLSPKYAYILYCRWAFAPFHVRTGQIFKRYYYLIASSVGALYKSILSLILFKAFILNIFSNLLSPLSLFQAFLVLFDCSTTVAP